MQYKSESGTILYRINRDFGVAKKICMDNVPKQTGYNVEIQRVAILVIMEVRTTEPYSQRKINLKVLVIYLRKIPREEEFRGINPRGSGT